MVKKNVVIIADYSQPSYITLEELLQICNISEDLIDELIDFGIIHPKGCTHAHWTFALDELERVKTALRLKRDLELNFAGAAVVLDLLEELEQLHARIELLEKHYSKL